MQLRMFADHPELRPKPNFNQETGEIFQHYIASKTDGLIGEEMRGSYIQDNICINFANDIVTNDYILETKSVSKDRPVEDWYFNSSILQCAIYKSLLSKCGGELVTATFFIELGNPLIKTKVKPNIDYLLHFGEDTYKINVTDTDRIIDFILRKAKASLTWTEAKNFDYHYKHLEYETLKEYFTYEKVTNICKSESNTESKVA